ncbi:septal ring lytic transglycosylase RlpA family protein [Xylella taiwanensis]|uniref:Endolytic peptidoglycan transglycosylase RlpA n=1 Tax=Xylella taiwanensis TaxID=1444770 RepID=Z9JFS3_9GAMM|nr:septal ring lytic transglycosylase RlpA family protein [Xylella taiwanensis]AXI83683.1 lipoprotein [Xylella taiwanensis]EWS77009.1 rare lipoprotein A [Xylella taiwanensis]MCD8456771.1 septal ring lytic transglycosylase RlpA family protein [Xylella taiwanensis]MCD8459181.1 septal ring lytic transglycosylase RlpA family protein [Xylella taiwanensis]MCD8461927.1 septal ring lytic transglycosylase RlpA family protein [Xylella taiwanensis]
MNTRWYFIAFVFDLMACSTTPHKGGTYPGTPTSKIADRKHSETATLCPPTSPYAPAKELPSTRNGYTKNGLYKPGIKDGVPDEVPDVACIPEPLVTVEPRSVIGNQSPYVVLGKSYRVLDEAKGYVKRGIASYYGTKFHGRLTSNREVYDMYAFTAAHKTLPLPSFALITNLDNGQSVVVRVNDRGPFHDDRLIDLSYAAAVKLGFTENGLANVEVRVLSEDDNPMLLARNNRRIAPTTASALASTGPTTTAQTPTNSISATVKPDNPINRLQSLPTSSPSVTTLTPIVPVTTITTRPPEAPIIAAASVSKATPPSETTQAPLTGTLHVPEVATTTLDSILVQVASFASRENANRALTQLTSAGIVGASISAIVSSGRTLWRLRVDAPDHDTALELIRRITPLGLGRPQIVGL